MCSSRVCCCELCLKHTRRLETGVLCGIDGKIQNSRTDVCRPAMKAASATNDASVYANQETKASLTTISSSNCKSFYQRPRVSVCPMPLSSNIAMRPCSISGIGRRRSGPHGTCVAAACANLLSSACRQTFRTLPALCHPSASSIYSQAVASHPLKRVLRVSVHCCLLPHHEFTSGFIL